MPKILLYRPALSPQTIRTGWLFNCEPLELEYLYTVLRPYGEIDILDGQLGRIDLVKEVAREKPDLLLITSIITNVDAVLQLAEKVKRLQNPPLIFIGGPHAEVLPHHYFHPAVDAVFYSNQLRAVEQVVRAIQQGESFEGTPGAAFRRGNTFQINEPSATHPEEIPIPERPMLAKYGKQYRFLYFDRCASLKTSLGCPEKCSFCFCRKMNGGHYGRRPLEEVIREIESIPNRNIFIVDDNFLLSPAYVDKFCTAIRQRSMDKQFIVYATSRFIARHPEHMRALKASGLAAVLVGFEFIDDQNLQAYQKGSALADNEETIKVCHELDIDLYALFMVDPAWPVTEFRKLAAYIRKRNIFLATFGTLTTLPGTDLWEAENRQPSPGDPWWRYDLLRLHQQPAHMSFFRYYAWVAYLFLLPSLRPGALQFLLRKGGWKGLVRMLASGYITAFEFLIKLTKWP
jgi:radical SAM superfamily enzyme YgiQ (UPF0313 family)